MAVSAVLGARFAWHAEIDPSPSAILAHHYPGVPNLGDIKRIDWSAVQPVDIFTGGYPCQPFSSAGRQLGAEDPRHLWPFLVPALRTLRPRYAFFENVANHLRIGFADVLADLAGIGYDVRWVVLPASAMGLAQGRRRLFILAADAERDGRAQGESESAVRQRPIQSAVATADAVPHAASQGRWESGYAVAGDGCPAAGYGAPEPGRRDSAATHTDGARPQGTQPAEPDGWSRLAGRAGDLDWRVTIAGRVVDYGPAVRRWERLSGRPAPYPTIIGKVGQAKQSPYFTEWLMGLPAGHVTDPAIGLTTNQQLSALGNGVVPQQAEAALRWLIAQQHPTRKGT